MVEGRMKKFFQENCLMEQAYIKDSEKKVSELLTESIATLGENITSVGMFVLLLVNLIFIQRKI